MQIPNVSTSTPSSSSSFTSSPPPITLPLYCSQIITLRGETTRQSAQIPNWKKLHITHAALRRRDLWFAWEDVLTVRHFATCATQWLGGGARGRGWLGNWSGREMWLTMTENRSSSLLGLFDVCETYFVFCWFCGNGCTHTHTLIHTQERRIQLKETSKGLQFKLSR